MDFNGRTLGRLVCSTGFGLSLKAEFYSALIATELKLTSVACRLTACVTHSSVACFLLTGVSEGFRLGSLIVTFFFGGFGVDITPFVTMVKGVAPPLSSKTSISLLLLVYVYGRLSDD